MNNNIEIVYISIDKLIPYENNPRINDEAVPYVVNSIKAFGFKVPIVVTEDNVIVAGHTRLKAAKQLNMGVVPCIIASDLTDEQIKAFRLADNKVGEFSNWDFETLNSELGELNINMLDFGFDEVNKGVDWDKVPDLTDENYDEPQKDLYRCPHCGHVDTKTHFIKVNQDENIS